MPRQLELFDPEPSGTSFLFFTIFPQAGPAARIVDIANEQRAAHRLQGAPLGQKRFHVSLFGFREVNSLSEWLTSRAIVVAAMVMFAPFDVTFDRVMSFGGARRPFVLCGGSGLASLIAFQRSLTGTLEAAGLARAGTSFNPH